MIIGLTGLYCAGKNRVGSLLEKRNLPVLDMDKCGHEAVRLETAAIVRSFGEAVLASDGLVDRRLLGKKVFGRPEELAILEAIVHPVINDLASAWITSQGGGLCIINAAVLHKFSVFGQLDAIIAVTAPLPLRLYRAVKRDKLRPKELFNRFLSQRNFPSYLDNTDNTNKKKSRSQLFFPSADIYIIRNSGFSGSLGALEKRIDAILEGLYNGREKGKEKITAGSCFGGGFPGDRSKRCDSCF